MSPCCHSIWVHVVIQYVSMSLNMCPCCSPSCCFYFRVDKQSVPILVLVSWFVSSTGIIIVLIVMLHVRCCIIWNILILYLILIVLWLASIKTHILDLNFTRSSCWSLWHMSLYHKFHHFDTCRYTISFITLKHVVIP